MKSFIARKPSVFYPLRSFELPGFQRLRPDGIQKPFRLQYYSCYLVNRGFEPGSRAWIGLVKSLTRYPCVHFVPLHHSLLSNLAFSKEEVKDCGTAKHDQEMLRLLTEYYKEHGDCHVPVGRSTMNREERRKLEVSEDLANWIVEQRQEFRKMRGKRNRFTKTFQERVNVLESMGFIWSTREAQWHRAFNRFQGLANFQLGNHDVNREEHPQLAGWVDMQRKAYKLDKMPPHRVELLRGIGFMFDPYEARWSEMFDKLKLYKEEHGDTLVNIRYEKDNLGDWVSRQRKMFHTGQLTEERINALESIGFYWNAHDHNWNRCYKQLLKFYDQHGHTNIPRSERILWGWLHTQRRRAKELLQKQGEATRDITESLSDGRQLEDLDHTNFEDGALDVLNLKRLKQLNDVPFKVEIFEETWKEHYESLCLFKERFGHVGVTMGFEDKALAYWVRRQRSLHGQDRMSEDRKKALEEIGFAWTARDGRWDRLYVELCKFYDKHGHCHVPASEGSLYLWTNQQRNDLGQYVLEAREQESPRCKEHKRVVDLDMIDFDWNLDRR